VVKYLKEGEDFSPRHFKLSKSSGTTKIAQGAPVKMAGGGALKNLLFGMGPEGIGPAVKLASVFAAKKGGAVKAEANGGFIKGAIKHPGRIKNMAAREGISTAAAASKASHSTDPSLRAAGNLAKRFISGDLSKKGKG